MNKLSTAMFIKMFMILIVDNMVIVVFLECFSERSDSDTTNTIGAIMDNVLFRIFLEIDKSHVFIEISPIVIEE